MTDDESSSSLLENPQVKKTPLPKTQLGLALFVLFTGPMSAHYIFPFINQLIRELDVTGGDDRKIGYYAGVIESLFYATQALTIFYWSRLSDHIGRKPVLLVGLMGLSVSNLCFGLSRAFWALVASRCIAGALNGNVGEKFTDNTNMAQAFALIPIAFTVGASVAPLYGGGLAKPHDHWPELFSGSFWVQYPSLPLKRRGRNPRLTPGDDEDVSPVPLSTLLTTNSVMLPIANYGMLALVDIALFSLVPLFYATPCMMAFGTGNGLFQMIFVARAVDYFGERRVFCSAVLAFFPIIVAFPTMSWVIQAQKEVGPAIWALILVQLLSWDSAVIFVIVTKASPNKHSLGTVNGLSQTTTSIARAVGPATFTSLFAFSKEHNFFGGNLAYVVLLLLLCLLVFLSRRLPGLSNMG
ncbi:major facilitator superfamily domain-containing protein [Pisolithus sp. B1]|nr:major facilitator superfamily domain-containing protein [Pisolithus sp. B1]